MNEPQRLITVEEFAAMTQDDDWTEELLGGVIHRSPPGRVQHGLVCANTARLLGEYCHVTGFGKAALGSGLVVTRNPDSVLAPDVQVFAKDRPPDEQYGWPTVPPVLVVEVSDGPGDYSHVMYKVRLYLAFGIDLVWVIQPGLRICVYRLADQRKPFDPMRWATTDYQNRECPGRHDALDGGDVLPGFSCKVADLFDRS